MSLFSAIMPEFVFKLSCPAASLAFDDLETLRHQVFWTLTGRMGKETNRYDRAQASQQSR
jgi:hypothetical protein